MKIAPSNSQSADPQSRPTLPISLEGAQHATDVDPPTSAVEAVRYLYLAKELRRLGQHHAAERWQAKAMTWLENLSASSDGI